MPRSLPMSPSQTSTNDSVGAVPINGRLEGSVSIFDPAMCCSTGLCGAGVDPALLKIARDLRWLEKQGVTLERFGLAQHPGEFASSPRVAGLMQAFGDAALPAVLVNGDVLSYGRYATREELVAALTTSAEKARGCCTPGSGCC